VAAGRQPGRRRESAVAATIGRAALAEARRNAALAKERGVRYVRVFTIPRSIPAGRVLAHNHIKHTVNTPQGWRGFRAWTEKAPPPGWVKCECGWSGLPHYRRAA
jgi:hypothetical protein